MAHSHSSLTTRIIVLINAIHRARRRELFTQVCGDLAEFLEVDQATLYEIDRESARLTTQVTEGNWVKAIEIPLDTSTIPGFVAFHRQPAMVNTVEDGRKLAESWNPAVFVDTWTATHRILTLPLTEGNDFPGILQLVRQEGDFTSDDLDRARLLEESLAQALQDRAREGRVYSRFAALLERGILDDATLERAFHCAGDTGRTVEWALVDHFGVDRQDLLNSLAQFYRLPAVDLTDWPEVDLGEGAQAIPQPLLFEYSVLPIQREADRIVLAMAHPLDESVLADLAYALECEIIPHVAIREDIEAQLKRLYPESHPPSESGDLVGWKDEGTQEFEDILDLTEGIEEETEFETSPIIRFVDSLLHEGVNKNASHIYLEPREDGPLQIRYRLEGQLVLFQEIPHHMTRGVTARLKIMAYLDIAERRLPQRGRIEVSLADGRRALFQVATLPTGHGEEEVMLRRYVSVDDMYDLDSRDMSDTLRKEYTEVLEAPHGLIFLGGSRDAGVGATIQSSLFHLEGPSRRICSVEEPYIQSLNWVTQLQVRREIGFGTSQAIRAALRSDPDVLAIGFINDMESMDVAVDAGLSGVLVLGYLPSYNVFTTLDRPLDMGIGTCDLQMVWRASLCQFQVPRLCSRCRESYSISAEKLAGMVEPWQIQHPHGGEGMELYRPGACEYCRYTGYYGRATMYEFLRPNEKVLPLIGTRSDRDKWRAAAEGTYHSFGDDGLAKLKDGLCSASDLQRMMRWV